MNIFTNKIRLLSSLLSLSIFSLLACYREESKTLGDKMLTGEELFREIILIDGKDVDKKIPEYSQAIEELSRLIHE